MFRSIKVSVTLGAAVLVAAPGCCLPNLLCNHSSPSEETVITGNSSQCVGNYSAVSTDCGCACDAGVVENGVAEDDKYIVSTTMEEEGAFTDESPSSDIQPTPALDSTLGGSGSKVIDIVKPPADLKTPIEASMPGD